MSKRAGTTALGSWRAALASLLLLAASQLAIAGHQFQHDADAVGERCGICQQIGELGQLIAVDAPSVFDASIPVPLPTAGLCTEGTACPAPYLARAPPRL